MKCGFFTRLGAYPPCVGLVQIDRPPPDELGRAAAAPRQVSLKDFSTSSAAPRACAIAIVVPAIVLLASSKSEFLTGQIVAVNGGKTVL